MQQLIIPLSGAERAELDDLADATGTTPEEQAVAALREHLRRQRARVGDEAARLAQRHAELLKRLGA
ncbi:hypothetical protein [Streptomyces sp. NPDC048349]|uniref:hypothetical protein n=1 Tax=Streptomyces sp. NPDC048349 TaxID=3155486 RepID=UPI003430C1FC